MDVLDVRPEDWPAALAEPYKDVLDKPAEWAKKCVEEFGAEAESVLNSTEYIPTRQTKMQTMPSR